MANIVQNKPADEFSVEIRKLVNPSMYFRFHLDLEWFESFLFFHGVQWYHIPGRSANIRKINIPDFIPQTVTNKYRQYAELLIALLSRVEPNSLIFPSQDNDKCNQACTVARAVISALQEENGTSAIRAKMAQLLVLTGNAFTLCDVEEIPNVQHNMAMLMMKEGMAELEKMDEASADRPGLIQALDQSSQFISQYKAQGRHYTDVFSPFEVFANMATESIDDQESIAICQIKSCEWVERTYGYKPTPQYSADILGLQFAAAIPFISNSALNYGGGMFGNNGINGENCYVKRLFKRPTQKYPEGLQVTMVGDKVVSDPKPLPVDLEDNPYLPMTHVKFDPVPHAFFGRSPMVALIAKQRSRNRWESQLEITHMRTGSPQWITTPGTVMTPSSHEPGGEIKVSLVGDKAQMPQRLAGVPVDVAATNRLKEIDTEMGDLCAVVDAMMGKLTYSGAPNSLAQTLIAQGQTRFGPVFDALGADHWVQWDKYQLCLFRQFGSQTRTYRAMDDFGAFSITSFSNADFDGGVTLKIENGSTVPRSESVEVARLESFVAMGIVNPQDPVTAFKILKRHGGAYLISENDVQEARAAEASAMIMAGQMPIFNPVLNDPIVWGRSIKKAANQGNVNPQQKLLFTQFLLEMQVSVMDVQSAIAPQTEAEGSSPSAPKNPDVKKGEKKNG